MPALLVPSRMTEPTWSTVIALIVADETPDVGQSTINSWPTRCRSVIRLKTRCAADTEGVVVAELVGGAEFGVEAGVEPGVELCAGRVCV
jgi:hypothetical protein